MDVTKSGMVSIAAAIVALCGACGAPQMTDLSTWQGCLIQSSLAEDPSPNGPLTAGDGTQTLYASWSIPNKFATLNMEIPGSLPRNKAVFVGGADGESDFKVRYQQGDTMQTYDSYTVKGQVTVVDFSAQKVTLDVDLTASEPVTDLNVIGPVSLKGRFEMQRVNSIKTCRFP